ncbi:MAG TPA: 5'/3'-nucleotidase SurE, partial [Vicinamibacterales bacterium]|nr:5'/3'-nucleotidase SurE [Vicinamibacterales bacterium]
MPRILVTNDDGVRSEGIHALAEALRPLGDVVIVAPHVEASAIGHALTLRRPLRIEQLESDVYEVDGTPTDCVNIGVAKVLNGIPDLIVSGINKGYNLGDDVTYSGTVSGALEGALLGVPSVAVSLERTSGFYDFEPAASAAATIAAHVLRGAITPPTFLSLNVPTGKPKGFRLT